MDDKQRDIDQPGWRLPALEQAERADYARAKARNAEQERARQAERARAAAPRTAKGSVRVDRQDGDKPTSALDDAKSRHLARVEAAAKTNLQVSKAG